MAASNVMMPMQRNRLTLTKKGEYDTTALNNRYLDEVNNASGYGAQEDDALNRVASFDPSSAFQDYAKNAYAGASNTLGLELDNLRDSAVRGGRLDTGFYDRDQGVLARQIYGDANRDINSKALETTRLQQQNNATYLDATGNREGRYLDLLTGALDRDQEMRDRKSAKKKGLFGSLVGAAGSIGGGILGAPLGPAGIAAGASAGGQIGMGLGQGIG